MIEHGNGNKIGTVLRHILRGILLLCPAAALLVCACAADNIEKGMVSLNLGDYAMAIEFFGAELKRHPERYEARLGMGKALLQKAVTMGDDTLSWRQALIHFEAARTINPSNEILPLLSEAWSAYARIILDRGDTLLALAALTRAIEYAPRSVEPVNLAGIIYFKMGFHDKSEALFSRAVEIDSTHPTAHFNMGMIALERGDFSRAHASLLKAYTCAPEDKDILYWFAFTEKKLREESGE